MHREHAGLCSSHFFLRSRHVQQPLVLRILKDIGRHAGQSISDDLWTFVQDMCRVPTRPAVAEKQQLQSATLPKVGAEASPAESRLALPSAEASFVSWHSTLETSLRRFGLQHLRRGSSCNSVDSENREYQGDFNRYKESIIKVRVADWWLTESCDIIHALIPEYPHISSLYAVARSL